MPNYDGTGPLGNGRPGRGLGPCGRADIPQCPPFGRGFRRGQRRGFGGFGRFGRGRLPEIETPMSNSGVYPYEKEMLQEEKSRLEKVLAWINDRITEMDK